MRLYLYSDEARGTMTIIAGTGGVHDLLAGAAEWSVQPTFSANDFRLIGSQQAADRLCQAAAPKQSVLAGQRDLFTARRRQTPSSIIWNSRNPIKMFSGMRCLTLALLDVATHWRIFLGRGYCPPDR